MRLESKDLLYIMTTIISYQKGEVPLYTYIALLNLHVERKVHKILKMEISA